MAEALQPVASAASRLGLKRIYAGNVPGSTKRYKWQGDWLRLVWYVPRSYVG